MKIYGFTVVNSEGNCDGTESETHLFATQDLQEKEAYKSYRNAFLSCDFEKKKDENGDRLMTKKEFLEELTNKEPKYILIQASDYHIQIELFEYEIESEVQK